MANPYTGDVISIDQARKAWRPGENRVRFAGGIRMDDFDEIFQVGDQFGASDINVQVGDVVRMQINNKWVPFTSKVTGTKEIYEFLEIAYDKIGPGEVNQRGRPIDHAYVVKPRQPEDRKIRIRLNATGGRDPMSDSSQLSSGIQITCRILAGVPPKLEDRNVEPGIISGFKPGPGMTLVTGPTGSGKTTLLGGAIRHIAENPENSVKIIEYSAPIELVYDDLHFPNSFIHQLEVGRAIRLRDSEGGNAMLWAACVANAMRRKPDIILIGEARDAATIESCITAAMTGHGLLSTMHTIGVAETQRRAIMSLPADQRSSVAIDLMEMSNMYVTQLLVPKKYGGRIAIREFIKFDATTRRKIIASPMSQWMSMIQDMMKRGDVECQRMIDAARDAYDKDLIDENQLEFLSARQRESDRVKPIDVDAPAISLGVNSVDSQLDPNMKIGSDEFEMADV